MRLNSFLQIRNSFSRVCSINVSDSPVKFLISPQVTLDLAPTELDLALTELELALTELKLALTKILHLLLTGLDLALAELDFDFARHHSLVAFHRAVVETLNFDAAAPTSATFQCTSGPPQPSCSMFATISALPLISWHFSYGHIPCTMLLVIVRVFRGPGALMGPKAVRRWLGQWTQAEGSA